ncbi:hypothetical protein VTJ83DRAFT_5944 [Remersonia thermophila]|uniref:Calcineurin-like phosphoesterase domain-containing protein n=1 Tax=Remersonia thermophila TaxID=72144 RepID=A0ABR4D8J7_9PEZI
MLLRGILALGLLCHGVIGAPQKPATEQRAAPRRRLHGRFLHITDIHPDQFYKAHSSTDEHDACHRGKGEAGRYGAAATECDSPLTLVNTTFDWIAAHLRDKVDFVVWTGDSARHDRDERLPRSLDQVFGANQWVADKLVELFSSNRGSHGGKEGGKSSNGGGGDAGAAVLDVPIVPTFGNNDILPHNILLPGPNRMLSEYASIWRPFIPEEQRHSFEFGGWFLVEVIPNRLAVVSLNTLYFFDRNAGVDGCADAAEPGYKQMEWLRVQLQFLRDRRMKAILMGHVPPARTDSKALWDETCWQRYTLWLDRFRDVVVSALYGHMNIDHFLIDDREAVNIDDLTGRLEEVGRSRHRVAMDDDLTIQGAADYMQELRTQWTKLVQPPRERPGDNVTKPSGDAEMTKGKRGKKKKGGKKKPKRPSKHNDPWGERYHLSLISPSVVPTYFPSLRVYEYNITGLEDAIVWADFMMRETGDFAWGDSSPAQKHLDLRHLSFGASTENDETTPYDSINNYINDTTNVDRVDADRYNTDLIAPSDEAANHDDEDDDDDDTTPTSTLRRTQHRKPHHARKSSRRKPGRGGRKKRPPVHDPHLVIPDPPPHSAPPGPAYSPQPLTLLGYTQYFANLTKIHMKLDQEGKKRKKNDTSESGAAGVGDAGKEDNDGRDAEGDGEEQTDVVAGGAGGSGFFQVEYSTFEDPVLRLKDLTVNSFLRLAVRMGKGLKKKKKKNEIGTAVESLVGIEGEEKGMGWWESDDEEEKREDESGDEEIDSDHDDDETDGTDGTDGEESGEDNDGEDMETSKRIGRPRKRKGNKGRKGRKNRRHNKTWLHFLKYAFVGVFDEDELKEEFD